MMRAMQDQAIITNHCKPMGPSLLNLGHMIPAANTGNKNRMMMFLANAACWVPEGNLAGVFWRHE